MSRLVRRNAKALLALLVSGAILAGAAAAQLGGAPQSSWLPGQQSLASYPEYAQVLSRAERLAQERVLRRQRALAEMERRKREAAERADAEARRKYEEAKRRAERAYQIALKKAAEERARQLAEQARLERERRRAEREREKLLEVKPGEECELAGTREAFDCRKGRLPDNPPKKKRK